MERIRLSKTEDVASEPINVEQSEKWVPDAINCSISKNFTQIPNDLLRDPNISLKAKALLCLLLSNRQGWHTCVPVLKTIIKEGEAAIRTALRELEKWDYLRIVRYRDEKTKSWKGSFWAYTDIPGQFYMDEQKALLKEKGYEIYIKNAHVEKQHVHKQHIQNVNVENQDVYIYNNTNSKNTNINNTNSKNIGIFENGESSQSFQDKDKDFSMLKKLSIPPEFFDVFLRWLHYKRKRGQSYKDEDSTYLAYKKLYKLSDGDPEVAMEIVENSMANNYSGLFPLKEDSSSKPITSFGSRRFGATVEDDYREPDIIM